jgi:hypothetical protein
MSYELWVMPARPKPRCIGVGGSWGEGVGVTTRYGIPDTLYLYTFIFLFPTNLPRLRLGKKPVE